MVQGVTEVEPRPHYWWRTPACRQLAVVGNGIRVLAVVVVYVVVVVVISLDVVTELATVLFVARVRHVLRRVAFITGVRHLR